MSEIEKAREALVEKLMIEGGGTRSEAEDVVAYFAPFIEASARAIAREEIEAAKGIDAGVTGAPELDAQTFLEFRRWFNSLPTKHQKGGDPHSAHGRPAGHAGNNSPPAVEAPAAGEDTTALARRLAEALNKVWLSGEPEVHEREVESALEAARKAGLIE